MAPSTPHAPPAVATVSHSVLPWWKDDGLRRLLFCQSWILAAQMISGYDQTVTSSFQSMDPWLEAMGNPRSDMLGLITAALYIGGFVGAIVAAFPADRFGRRFVLQFGQLFEVIGSIMQAASKERGIFIGGRVIVGFGMSLTTVAGPNLLAETCHPRLRGKVAPAFNVLWYVGSIIAGWLCFGTGHLDTHWSWRIPSIVQAVLPFTVMIGVSWMPESPRWLYAHGRHDEARAFFVRYHANGNEADEFVAFEMEEVTAALEQEAESRMYTWGSLVQTKANRMRMFIVTMVAISTLWNGQGIITYYFTEMLNSVGITTTNEQTGINGGMSIWNLFCSIGGVLLADKIGRRALWLTAFIGMVFANVPLTISSAMYTEHGWKSAAYASVVFMFLYNAAFNIGCNPLPYTYVPEILPFGIRAKGFAVFFALSEAALLVNQYVNPIAMASIGYWYYVFYLGMLFLFIAIIYFTYPETSGYSLEELSTLFEDGFKTKPKDTMVLVVGEEVEAAGGDNVDKKKDDVEELAV